MRSQLDNVGAKGRINSIDALRGLTVFVWLLSVTLAPVLCQLPRSPIAETLLAQLSPSFWNGTTVLDLLLSLFLFVAGASIVPAFNKRKAAGQTNRQIAKRILRRVVLLLAIGIVCEGAIWQDWPQLRFVGAFQRIAICYAVAAWLYLASGWRLQAGAVVFLLLDYWAILALKSGEANRYSLEGNAAALVDQLLLPGREYFGTWDPQGILTTMPAVAVAVAGVLAGKALTTDHGRSIARSIWLLGAGIAAVNTGLLGDLLVPINPYLWTVTFCLVAIGAASALLGLFHAVDVHRLRVCAPLAALGRNSLVIVLVATALMNSAEIVATRLEIMRYQYSPTWLVLVLVLIVTIAFALNRHRIYLSV